MSTSEKRAEVWRRTKEDLRSARKSLQNAKRVLRAAEGAEMAAWRDIFDAGDPPQEEES